MMFVYTVSACPVAERASRFSITSSSAKSATMRSSPMRAMCVGGRPEHMRPLPSFSTRQIDPVAATAKFTPVIPTPASRNARRRRLRA